MELSVEQYQAYLKENEPEQHAVTGKFELDAAGFQQLATALITQLQVLLDEGRIGFSSYEITTEPVATFSLEMSPVNLPMVDAKKVNQFFADEAVPVTLKIYLVTRSEFINVSKLHIDFLANSDAEISADQLAEMLAAKWALIEETFKNPPVPKPVAATTEMAKKVAAKKKTTKKTTTRKKAATKKATTKKITTKKTAAKKATTTKAAKKPTTSAAKKSTTSAKPKTTRKRATTKKTTKTEK